MSDQDGVYINVVGTSVFWDTDTNRFDLVEDINDHMSRCNDWLLEMIEKGNYY